MVDGGAGCPAPSPVPGGSQPDQDHPGVSGRLIVLSTFPLPGLHTPDSQEEEPASCGHLLTIHTEDMGREWTSYTRRGESWKRGASASKRGARHPTRPLNALQTPSRPLLDTSETPETCVYKPVSCPPGGQVCSQRGQLPVASTPAIPIAPAMKQSSSIYGIYILNYLLIVCLVHPVDHPRKALVSPCTRSTMRRNIADTSPCTPRAPQFTLCTTMIHAV